MPPSSPSAPPTKRSEVARARLIDAALRLFARRGVDGVSIREIAREAEQNSAAIAYYFGGKDGLYRAVLDSIVSLPQGRTREVAVEYFQLASSNQLTPESAERLLRVVIREMFLGVFCSANAMNHAVLMVREHTQPSAAYDHLYAFTVEPIHKMATHLVSVITGEPPDSRRSIIRTHAFFGQLMGFTMAREVIQRRLGCREFGPEQTAEILAVLEENLDILLAATRARTDRPEPSDPSLNR